jgi:hypothetical protein
MATRVFLSFAEEDLGLVNLFRGQAKNKNNDLEFADYSIKEPFDSFNSAYIKQGIREQIKYAAITICLYGPTTWTSSWVDWELKTTLELEKPIMGVYLYDDGRIKFHPGPLADWPKVSWDLDQISRTMNSLVLAAHLKAAFKK